MIIFVIGGSGSGKSAFAEGLVANSPIEKRTYIASMRVWDDEGRARVIRHREMRKNKGFDTLECPVASDLTIAPTGAILLEDLTNLAMNEWYGDKREEAVLRTHNCIKKIADSAELFVIVGNDIFADGIYYGEEMREYLEMQGKVNIMAAELADKIFEVHAGLAQEIEKTNFLGGTGVTLIIGGKHQGKLNYAKKISKNCEIFAHLETWLRDEMEPFAKIDEIIKKDVTIVCDEIGCGIVPMDATDRAWRERVGRVCCYIAQRADRVIYMNSGIPTILKDTKI